MNVRTLLAIGALLCMAGCSDELPVAESEPRGVSRGRPAVVADAGRGLPRHAQGCLSASVDAQVTDAEVAQDFSAIVGIMEDGTPEERCVALRELSFLRGCRAADDDETTRRTIEVMTLGLTDDDEGVRDVAFDTLQQLPTAERQALFLQALGNDDSEIKLALLDITADAHDEFSLTYNFQALDAEEEDVRELASDNLSSLIGHRFKSTEEAFDWWENDPEARKIAVRLQTNEADAR